MGAAYDLRLWTVMLIILFSVSLSLHCINYGMLCQAPSRHWKVEAFSSTMYRLRKEPLLLVPTFLTAEGRKQILPASPGDSGDVSAVEDDTEKRRPHSFPFPKLAGSTGRSDRSPNLARDGFELKPSLVHLFSPFTLNDEFVIVSNSWRMAVEEARKVGIEVDLVAAVLPEDVHAVPPFARKVILTKGMDNYRTGANPVPTYGEMFRVMSEQTHASISIYSNADIGFDPMFYVKVFRLMCENLSSSEKQAMLLERTRDEFFSKCKEFNVDVFASSMSDTQVDVALTLCARDAVVYYENLGGRMPDYPPALYRFFRGTTNASADESLNFAFPEESRRKDKRTAGNSITITRWQLPESQPNFVLPFLFGTTDRSQANSATLRRDALQKLYESESGEYHPGNDVFVLPRALIPRFLKETPFIHLRPSGFLIGNALRASPDLIFRRISSSPADPFTFHIGEGTNEFSTRVDIQPRMVLFEAAQYFTRLNLTTQTFFPPAYCQEKTNYRIGGTSHFCAYVSGDHCRGWTRLACTPFWYRYSKDTAALETACDRVSGKPAKAGTTEDRLRTLEKPFCAFCNVSETIVAQPPD